MIDPCTMLSLACTAYSLWILLFSDIGVEFRRRMRAAVAEDAATFRKRLYDSKEVK